VAVRICGWIWHADAHGGDRATQQRRQWQELYGSAELAEKDCGDMLSGGYCTVLVGCRKAGVDYVEMPLVVVVPWMQCGEILPSFAYMAWYMHGNRQFLRRHVMELLAHRNCGTLRLMAAVRPLYSDRCLSLVRRESLVHRPQTQAARISTRVDQRRP
jgi:hypothetical protein